LKINDILHIYSITKEELIQRLNDIEWEDFEVKLAKSELPRSIWSTISAFSNSAGGWLVLGVEQLEQENLWEYFFMLFERLKLRINVHFKMGS
jgi:predicted HTH transcriptional regulator